MYEIAVERSFWAGHAVTVSGGREEPHHHNWQVRVVIGGDRLDRDGLLCDFHVIEAELARVLATLDDRDLNRSPAFGGGNPTAERVARHVADSLRIPAAVRLLSVSVTEAPGCVATYRP
jgi:6-pyruvoyltetrahydropterin/6-carboxytetrahydropterin synthase